MITWNLTRPLKNEIKSYKILTNCRDKIPILKADMLIWLGNSTFITVLTKASSLPYTLIPAFNLIIIIIISTHDNYLPAELFLHDFSLFLTFVRASWTRNSLSQEFID
jgi:hypothetical protein